MIKGFRSKALKLFWMKGDASRLPADQITRIRRILVALDDAKTPEEMNTPGNRLHELKGDRADIWSVTITGNWRITFRFDGADVVLLDHEDYH